jgi:hypothetical protein
MKTIVRNGTNVSLYLFDDSAYVDIAADKTTIGDPVQFYIDDCTTSNVTLFEGVTNPDEWTGWKYLYTAEGGWVLNPDWTPPEA